jgi:uncharacterized protein YodC (DUF2158 family)
MAVGRDELLRGFATGRKASEARQAMDFKPGEIVQLKSGGRGMTVVRQTKDQVDLVWYADSDDALRTATVTAACLSLIEFDDDDIEDDD